MEMTIQLTVINTEDIIALEGEKVTFELPEHRILPVGILDTDGNLLGYLGRNDATCVPNTSTGQDFCQLLEEGWELSGAVVAGTTYYKTSNRKLLLNIELAWKEELIVI